MKIKWIFSFLMLTIFSCKEKEVIQTQDEPKYFLSDIRPVFFEHLNFDSKQMVDEIPSFLRDFKKTHERIGSEYESGLYKSNIDLETMRMSYQYYSFFLTGIVRGYMDKDLTINQIAGTQKNGLFSGLTSTAPNFVDIELEAMMKVAERAALISVNLNGVTDRTWGFYGFVRQIHERFKHKNGYLNNNVIQDSLIQYLQVPLNNYIISGDWNLLMAMTSFTNYADSLNTFKNPSMDRLLTTANARLSAGNLKSNKFPDIFGPIYRFDLNFKKADWVIHQKEKMDKNDVKQLMQYIGTLDFVTNFLDNDDISIKMVNAWKYKVTIQQRKEKVKELKDYVNSIIAGKEIKKPEFATYLNSKEFNKAYACYTCHQPTGL